MDTPLQRARISDTRKPSQEDIAGFVGITQSYYSRIERGAVQATPDIAEKLVRFFGNRVSEVEILYPERFTSTEPKPAQAEVPA